MIKTLRKFQTSHGLLFDTVEQAKCAEVDFQKIRKVKNIKEVARRFVSLMERQKACMRMEDRIICAHRRFELVATILRLLGRPFDSETRKQTHYELLFIAKGGN